jgi:hypothetical protein
LAQVGTPGIRTGTVLNSSYGNFTYAEFWRYVGIYWDKMANQDGLIIALLSLGCDIFSKLLEPKG